MRKQPDPKLALAIDAHLTKGKQPAGTVTWTRKYKLITPLFGGGVSPMECDPVTIIRGSEIRGHLRFWWRATRGGQYNGDLSEMKKAEAKIWGAAHISKKTTTPPEKKDDEQKPPTVQIEVEVTKNGESKEVFGLFHKEGKLKTKLNDPDIPEYAAFPLRPTDDECKQGNVVLKKVQKDVEFILTITFAKDYEKEIRAALWAWETFGGIGARTRRGFGAIHCTEALPGIKPLDKSATAKPETLIKEIKTLIKGNLKAFISAEDKFPDDVPHLSRNLRFAPVLPSSPANKKQKRQNSTEQQKPLTINDAWIELVRRLKNFRQPQDKQHKWPDGESHHDIV